jgi:hypothetical protein
MILYTLLAFDFGFPIAADGKRVAYGRGVEIIIGPEARTSSVLLLH